MAIFIGDILPPFPQSSFEDRPAAGKAPARGCFFFRFGILVVQ
jgi:hypothetical protein